MKKILVLALSIIVVLLSFTACSGGSGSDATASMAPSSSAPGNSAPTGETEPVTLTFWGWEASDFEAKSIQAGIDAFEEIYPWISVDYMTVPSSDYHTKLKTALATNGGPDVFYLDATQVNDFVSAGLLMEITDLAGDFLDDMTKASLEKVSFTGEDGKTHIYGLDVCNVGPVIFYNVDLFDEAGVEHMPTTMEDRWTWDEFLANMQTLTKNDANGNAQYGTCNWEEQYSLYVLQEMLELNGTSWYNEDMTQAVNVDSPESVEVLNNIKDLRVKYGVAPDPNAAGSDTGNSPTAMFLTGQVASIAIGSYALQEISNSDINYGVGLFPTFGKDDSDAFIVSADMKALNVNTEHPEEAILLAEYMSSTDFGIPIYKTGLWMPSKVSMYEEENLDLWFDREVYPEGWENLLPVFENAKDKPTDKLRNVNAVNDAVDEELQAFYYADQDVHTTLINIETRINNALAK